MSDNSAVVKIIAKHTKEYNELSVKFKTLMKVHTKTVNDFADKSLAYAELKRDNKMLRESLDQAERELMEK